MKTILLLLISFSALAQQKFGIIEISERNDSVLIKRLVTQTIYVTDGMITKMITPPDTARLFLSSDGSVYEGVTVWKKVVVTPPVVIEEKIIDAEQATYSTTPKWTYHGTTGATGWEASTIAFSNVLNSTATFSFTGFKVDVYAERKSTQGVGYISIDGGPETEVKFNVAPYGVPVLVYTWTAPTQVNAVHTVVLRVGTGYSLLDYWKVFSVK